MQERARTVAGDNDLAVQTLEKRLRCTCGCNLDVFTCRTTDFTCATSPAMHREVLRQLESSTPDEVVASFVRQYGESILMQPPKRGFNWTAYLTPFAALVVGVGIVSLLMRRWMAGRQTDKRTTGQTDKRTTGQTDSEQPSSVGPSARLSDSDREKLNAALESYES